MKINVTDRQLQMIKEALREAADKVEDIDDPIHYSDEDLRNITKKANDYRKLASYIGTSLL